MQEDVTLQKSFSTTNAERVHGTFMSFYAQHKFNNNLSQSLIVINKRRGKLECLIFEMLQIKNKRLKLNTQADSIHAKLFTVMLS